MMQCRVPPLRTWNVQTIKCLKSSLLLFKQLCQHNFAIAVNVGEVLDGLEVSTRDPFRLTVTARSVLKQSRKN